MVRLIRKFFRAVYTYLNYALNFIWPPSLAFRFYLRVFRIWDYVTSRFHFLFSFILAEYASFWIFSRFFFIFFSLLIFFFFSSYLFFYIQVPLLIFFLFPAYLFFLCLVLVILFSQLYFFNKRTFNYFISGPSFSDPVWLSFKFVSSDVFPSRYPQPNLFFRDFDAEFFSSPDCLNEISVPPGLFFEAPLDRPVLDINKLFGFSDSYAHPFNVGWFFRYNEVWDTSAEPMEDRCNSEDETFFSLFWSSRLKFTRKINSYLLRYYEHEDHLISDECEEIKLFYLRADRWGMAGRLKRVCDRRVHFTNFVGNLEHLQRAQFLFLDERKFLFARLQHYYNHPDTRTPYFICESLHAPYPFSYFESETPIPRPDSGLCDLYGNPNLFVGSYPYSRKFIPSGLDLGVFSSHLSSVQQGFSGPRYVLGRFLLTLFRSKRKNRVSSFKSRRALVPVSDSLVFRLLRFYQNRLLLLRKRRLVTSSGSALARPLSPDSDSLTNVWSSARASVSLFFSSSSQRFSASLLDTWRFYCHCVGYGFSLPRFVSFFKILCRARTNDLFLPRTVADYVLLDLLYYKSFFLGNGFSTASLISLFFHFRFFSAHAQLFSWFSQVSSFFLPVVQSFSQHPFLDFAVKGDDRGWKSLESQALVATRADLEVFYYPPFWDLDSLRFLYYSFTKEVYPSAVKVSGAHAFTYYYYDCPLTMTPNFDYVISDMLADNYWNRSFSLPPRHCFSFWEDLDEIEYEKWKQASPFELLGYEERNCYSSSIRAIDFYPPVLEEEDYYDPPYREILRQIWKVSRRNRPYHYDQIFNTQLTKRQLLLGAEGYLGSERSRLSHFSLSDDYVPVPDFQAFSQLAFRADSFFFLPEFLSFFNARVPRLHGGSALSLFSFSGCLVALPLSISRPLLHFLFRQAVSEQFRSATGFLPSTFFSLRRLRGRAGVFSPFNFRDPISHYFEQLFSVFFVTAAFLSLAAIVSPNYSIFSLYSSLQYSFFSNQRFLNQGSAFSVLRPMFSFFLPSNFENYEQYQLMRTESVFDDGGALYYAAFTTRHIEQAKWSTMLSLEDDPETVLHYGDEDNLFFAGDRDLEYDEDYWFLNFSQHQFRSWDSEEQFDHLELEVFEDYSDWVGSRW